MLQKLACANRTGKPANLGSAASRAAGSLSNATINPPGATRSAKARVWLPPPSVPSTSTAPGRGSSHWTTSESRTGTCTGGGGIMATRPGYRAGLDASTGGLASRIERAPTSGTSLCPSEVVCRRQARRQTTDGFRTLQPGGFHASRTRENSPRPRWARRDVNRVAGDGRRRSHAWRTNGRTLPQ